VARPSVFFVEDKYRLVLAVVGGEMSVAEAARRGKASEQSISTWKRQFLEGGKAGLGEGGKPGVNPRERAMLDEIEELKAAHRRWQQRERQGRPVKGPWPSPARDRVELAAIAYADRFPAWGHRKLAMRRPLEVHLEAINDHQTIKSTEPESLPLS